MAVDPAIQNLFLDALLARVRAEFLTTAYSKRLTQFGRFAPTVAEIQAGAKLGSYWQWCDQQPKDYGGSRQQRNALDVCLYVATSALKATQEAVGIELLADLETIVIAYNGWRVTVPETGKTVAINVDAKGNMPLNANMLPEVAGGHLLVRATYSTLLGNPRRQPGGVN